MRARPGVWGLALALWALLWLPRQAGAAEHRPARPATETNPSSSPFLHALEHCERDPSRALDVPAARLFERIGPMVLRQVLIVTVPDPFNRTVLIHVGLPLLGLAATRFTTVGLLMCDFVN